MSRRRRRRRRNPGEWVTLRGAAGIAVGLLVPVAIELSRTRCDDGTPAEIGCQGDLTSAAILAAAPLAIGLGTARGEFIPGSFRSGIALAGVILGSALIGDIVTGKARLATMIAELRERPKVPRDVVVT